MTNLDVLVGWLKQRTAPEVAQLIDQRPYLLLYGPVPQTLGQLAQELVADQNLSGLLHRIDQPEQQLLTAAARLAVRHAQNTPNGGGRPGSAAAYGPVDYGWGRSLFMGPDERVVSERELLAALGAGGADGAVSAGHAGGTVSTDHADGRDRADRRHAAARAVLERLRARLLLLPAGPGQVGLPTLLFDAFGGQEHTPRRIDQALTTSFNMPSVLAVAAALGLTGDTRTEVQQRIVAYLSDPDRVRALVAAAPAGVRELVEQLLTQRGTLPTHGYQWVHGSAAKVEFRSGGSGDPATDWLARRGLLMPLGPDRAELPLEVVRALRGEAQYPFTPEPPPPDTVPAPAEMVRGEAQAAASAAAGRLELLLNALAERPSAVRKSGGLAVRDTRRLAKTIGVDEDETRLWIDLCAAAGLLGVKGSDDGSRVLLPTTEYDTWLDLPPADRLAPVVAVWSRVRDVVTWWPAESGESPVALSGVDDAAAPGMRLALLKALAGIPGGTGAVRPGPLVTAADLPDDKAEAQLGHLVATVAWYRPLPVLGPWDAAQRILATLREAELLGVAAHGALTSIGHALLSLLVPAAPVAAATSAATEATATADPARSAAAQESEYDPRAILRSPGMADLRKALRDVLPPPQDKAHFQADLTAVVTGAPSAALAAVLGAAADRESKGQAMVWRFTAASMRHALDAGVDAHQLLADLTRVAASGLPQALEYLVKDTARTHGRMRVVRSACCIRSDDEALVLELSKARALTKLGLRRIAPTVLISTSSVRATLDALRAAGYSPVLEAETGATVVERAERHRAPAPDKPAAKRQTRRGRATPTSLELARRLLGKN